MIGRHSTSGEKSRKSLLRRLDVQCTKCQGLVVVEDTRVDADVIMHARCVNCGRIVQIIINPCHLVHYKSEDQVILVEGDKSG